MTIQEWLTAWDGLDTQREQVAAMKDAASIGEGTYEEADSAGFDLWEQESGLAGSAAEIFRELHKNSTLPEDRGEKVWRHLEGDVCTEDTTKVDQFAKVDVSDAGICEEHDRIVNYADRSIIAVTPNRFNRYTD